MRSAICLILYCAWVWFVGELNDGEVTSHFVDTVAGLPRNYGSSTIDGIKTYLLSLATVYFLLGLLNKNLKDVLKWSHFQRLKSDGTSPFQRRGSQKRGYV